MLFAFVADNAEMLILFVADSAPVEMLFVFVADSAPVEMLFVFVAENGSSCSQKTDAAQSVQPTSLQVNHVVGLKKNRPLSLPSSLFVIFFGFCFFLFFVVVQSSVPT